MPPPQNQLVNTSVFSSYESANGAIIGIYSKMMESASANTFPHGYSTVLGGISSDELLYIPSGIYSSPAYQEIAESNIQADNRELQNFWSQAYQYINYANAVIEGLEKSTLLADSQRLNLSGEALFIRAWCHFSLINFFGAVPYITSSDYRLNVNAVRLDESEVLDRIIADLKNAETALSESTGNQRTRPDKWAARALLSKVFLAKGDWINAEQYSSTILNSNLFSLEDDPLNVFNKDGREVIWQLQPVAPPNYTIVDAVWFIPRMGADPTIILSDSLLKSFEPDDKRFAAWVDSLIISGIPYYYPFKYKVIDNLNAEQYYIVFRLAEQILIRAESRVHNNDLAGALADLNQVRSRAGLTEVTTVDPDEILKSILGERRIELFAEWGNRWIDLKRSGHLDEIMSAVKGNSWDPTDKLYPIPRSEILADQNLTQNPGY